MKRFTTIALVALVALAALIVPATAAEQTVEVRSEVFSGDNFSAIFDAEGGNIEINTTNFAGFWYDIDDDLSSETLTIMNDSSLVSGESISEEGLWYNASIVQANYTADFANEPDDNTTFPLIGLFADKYVPTADDDAGELVKLLMDSDDKYTLRTGSALELAGGYELTAKQIDVEGNKVWMELSKDGEFVEDEVISMPTDGSSATWDYEVDVGDQDDVIVFRALVTDVFQGQVDSLAVVEGIWLIDYENIMKIESADEFGELEVDEVSNTIAMFNSGTLTLSADKTIDLAEGMMLQTADSDDLRFALVKEYTEPGTYEIRGNVKEGDGSAEWTANEFAGFWYDIDDNESSETLTIDVDGESVDEEDLWYNTTIVQTGYTADFANESGDNNTFPIIGLFAQEYVATADDDAGELVKLLMDSDDKYTLRTGSALELAEGYELTAKQIDVEGDKVWMELSKDGEYIEDEVIDLSGDAESATWDYDVDVGDQDDVIVFRVLVTDVFQGQVDSLAVVEGLWLLDYENIMKIESADEFGELEVDEVSSTIAMFNSGTITLSADKEIDLAEGFMLKTADSDDLRYYPFVERTIGEEPTVTEPEEEMEEEEEMPAEDENVTEEEPAEEMPEEEPAEEMPEEEPEEEPAEETAEDQAPGFEAIFAVAGLLAVAYLVRRN